MSEPTAIRVFRSGKNYTTAEITLAGGQEVDAVVQRLCELFPTATFAIHMDIVDTSGVASPWMRSCSLDCQGNPLGS